LKSLNFKSRIIKKLNVEIKENVFKDDFETVIIRKHDLEYQIDRTINNYSKIHYRCKIHAHSYPLTQATWLTVMLLRGFSNDKSWRGRQEKYYQVQTILTITMPKILQNTLLSLQLFIYNIMNLEKLVKAVEEKWNNCFSYGTKSQMR
jgi:hypothetical protein